MKYQVGQWVYAAVCTVMTPFVIEYTLKTKTQKELLDTGDYILDKFQILWHYNKGDRQDYFLDMELSDPKKISSWKIEDYHVEANKLPPELEGRKTWRVTETLLWPVEALLGAASTGHKCVVCQEWSEWGVANLKDGHFACWSCRHDPRNLLESL